VAFFFIGGKPARITPFDFRRHHLASFPSLTQSPESDVFLSEIIETVYTMFPYVDDLWNWHPRQLWYDKTVLCYRLLVAWYIADMYPDMAAGAPLMGGIPVKRKKIDGVDVTYPDSAASGRQDILASLKSNPWGHKAWTMLKMAAKPALLRNCRFV
jgi:hypothetical protein